MSKHEANFAPRLMPIQLAASYIGVSPSKLRDLPIPRKILDGKRLYDKVDLDSYADNLATEGEADNGGW